MRRGRRDADCCAVGDVIDSWTVEAMEPDRRLLLSADLKLPGRGWLDFEVTRVEGRRLLTVRRPPSKARRAPPTGTHDPFHALIFRGLPRRIAQRGKATSRRNRLMWVTTTIVIRQLIRLTRESSGHPERGSLCFSSSPIVSAASAPSSFRSSSLCSWSLRCGRAAQVLHGKRGRCARTDVSLSRRAPSIGRQHDTTR